MAIEGEALPVGGVAAPPAPVRGQACLATALDGHLVERRHAGEGAVAASGPEDDLLRVGGPADHLVVAAVERESAGRPAARGNDEHVVVPVALGGESDPLPIRAEAGIDVPSHVIRETARVGAVLVDHPDVAQVAEGDLPCVEVGRPGQPHGGRTHGRRGQDEREGDEQQLACSDHGFLPDMWVLLWMCQPTSMLDPGICRNNLASGGTRSADEGRVVQTAAAAGRRYSRCRRLC